MSEPFNRIIEALELLARAYAGEPISQDVVYGAARYVKAGYHYLSEFEKNQLRQYWEVIEQVLT